VTDRGPLGGLRAVVTRPREGARALVDGLAEAGAEVIVAPLVAIEDPESWAPLDSAIEALRTGSYEWVAFPSANSVRKVLGRLDAAGESMPAGTRVAAVGPSTAGLLEARGIAVDLIPEPHTSDALASSIGEGRGRVLLPRVAGGPRAFADALASLGWEVDEVPAYRNVPLGPAAAGVDRIVSGDFDVITLASASAARNLAALVPPPAIGLEPGAGTAKTVACIGPSTAEAARAGGLRVDVVAGVHTAEGLVRAIIAHLEKGGTIGA